MLVLLLSVAAFGFDTVTGGLVRSYTRTMASVAWSASAGTISAFESNGLLATHRMLAEENAQLKAELQAEAEHTAQYAALESENAALREMAKVAETEGVGVTAAVLSTYRSSPYGTFVIAAGKSDGVNMGSIVLTQGGFVLGTVSDVDVHTATVQALFSPKNSIDLIVRDVAFTAEGRGGGNAEAEIPRDVTIAVGDAVLSPQFHNRVAGVIGSIDAASSSAVQTIHVRIPTNLNTLKYVYVVPKQ